MQYKYNGSCGQIQITGIYWVIFSCFSSISIILVHVQSLFNWDGIL